VAARHLLRQRRLAFEEISLDLDSRLRQQIRERSGRYTVPQIWIGDTHIGGYSELLAWDHAGHLQALVTEKRAVRCRQTTENNSTTHDITAKVES